MNLCLKTFSVVLLLFAAASCAPVEHSLQDACGDVRTSSYKLNQIAKRASVEARNGSNNVANYSFLTWMEAKDMCDPESLKRNSSSCPEKLLRVLQSYISAVDSISGFCQPTSQVKPAMQKLQEDMAKCLKSKSKTDPQKHPTNNKTKPIDHWERELLCHYTLDRLFSFSILTARVFAVGDPAHHAAGSAQTCS